MAFPVELLDQYPARGESLPVFALLMRCQRQKWVYLGHAFNQQDAATCGILQGVSCDKISITRPNDKDERKFYALH